MKRLAILTVLVAAVGLGLALWLRLSDRAQIPSPKHSSSLPPPEPEKPVGWVFGRLIGVQPSSEPISVPMPPPDYADRLRRQE
ncbi:MAG: hypothetical protein HY000_29585 [Planctomycetes bacterium]|nr:hypothetical protein [Planctomycetota bacterium]